MFDWEHRIALHAMQENRASSHREGEASWFFYEVRWELGLYSGVTTGMAIQNSCLFSDIRTPV